MASDGSDGGFSVGCGYFEGCVDDQQGKAYTRRDAGVGGAEDSMSSGSGGSEDGSNNRWQRYLLAVLLAEKFVEDELGRGSNPAEPSHAKHRCSKAHRCSDSPKVFLYGDSETLPK